MGQGPHLFRTGGSSAPSGGWMVLDCRGFDGLGRPGPFCQEVIRECAARNFTGVVCDFEAGRLPPLEETVAQLGKECARRNWALLVPRALRLLLSPHPGDDLLRPVRRLSGTAAGGGPAALWPGAGRVGTSKDGRGFLSPLPYRKRPSADPKAAAPVDGGAQSLCLFLPGAVRPLFYLHEPGLWGPSLSSLTTLRPWPRRWRSPGSCPSPQF